MALNVWSQNSGYNFGTFQERSKLALLLPVTSSTGVNFSVISGTLPPGLSLKKNTQSNLWEITGTPFEVPRGTTFKFCIRASANSQIADRTFSIDIQGADEPTILTAGGDLPAGPNSSYFVLDQSYVNFQISAIDYDTSAGQSLHYFIADNAGELPPGLTMSDTGLITGLVEPALAIKITDGDGSFDNGFYDAVVYDFGTRPSNGFSSFLYDQIYYDYSTPTNPPKKVNRNYEFIVSVTDGDSVAEQKFRMFVVADDFFRADNTYLPAGTGVYKADGTYLRAPIWKTPEYLGIVRANNYLIEKLDIYEPGGDAIIVYDFISGTLPPGITFDRNSGEIFGTLPYQPAVTKRYTFTVSATRYSPQVTENAITNRTFYIDVQGEIDSVIDWVSSTSLGTLPANFISNLRIDATTTVDNATLVYTLEDGRLPPGLTLMPDGEIVGKVNQYGSLEKAGLTRFYDTDATLLTSQLVLTASTLTPPYGSNLLLTATLSPASGTGIVTFKNNGVVLGTATVVNGVAPFVTSSLTVGSHSITATYSGSYDVKPSTSNALAVVVSTGITFINLTSSVNTESLGNTITFTVNVTSPSGLPTGVIDLKDNGTVILSSTLTNGIATFSVDTLSVGTHPITATYYTDRNFSTISSSSINIVVTPQLGTIPLSGLTVTALPGSLISYKASLTLRATTIHSNLTGDVYETVAPNLVTLSTVTGLYNRQQIVITGGGGGLAAGTYYIANAAAGVNRITVSTTLQNAINNVVVTVSSATLSNTTYSAPTPAPTGTVIFKEGSTVLGSGAVSNGIANFTTTNLAAGTHNITALYSGNTYYTTATSGSLPVVVNKLPTAISFIASSESPLYGNPFILEARVTAQAGTPTGTITIKEGNVVLGVVNLEDKLAIFTSSNRVTVGSHTYTATYSGDTNFSSSISYGVIINVQSSSVPYSANSISGSAITSELGGSRAAQYNTWTISNGSITFKGTGLPYHSYGNIDDPNIPTAQDYNLTWVYRAGEYLPAATNTPVTSQIVGMWLNGVAMFGPSAGSYAPIGMQVVQGFTYNASSEMNVALGYTFGEDAAGGHTLPNGKYHYHDGNFIPAWTTGQGGGNARPENSTGIADDLVIPYLNDGVRHPNGHSKILGISADGYPVYGPWGYIDPTNSNSGVQRMISGYQLRNSSYRYGTAAANMSMYPMGMFTQDFEYVSGVGKLDAHNGRYCVTPDFPNGTYAYFITVDSSDNPVYPYVIGNTFFSTPTDLGS